MNWTGKVILGRRRDGTPFPIELTVSEMDTGEKPLYTAILRDTSERRALEREVLEISTYEHAASDRTCTIRRARCCRA